MDVARSHQEKEYEAAAVFVQRFLLVALLRRANVRVRSTMMRYTVSADGVDRLSRAS